MEASNDDLLKEWDVVSSDQENFDNTEKTKDDQENNPVTPYNEPAKEIEEIAVSGQVAVDPLGPAEGSAVEDIVELDHESNTSSDIDVIDEPNIEEGHLSTMPAPVMQLSIGTSMEASTLSNSMMSTNPALPLSSDVEILPGIQGDESRGGQMLYLVICVAISILFMFISNAELPAEKKVSQLQEIVETLQEQNNKLKDQVTLKAEKDALLHTLENEVSTLKLENTRMGESMTSLMQQLEEQAAIYMKENREKKNYPYQNELDNLREEINLLKIDNDALQQQLVRLRYVKYTPINQDPVKEQPNARTENSKTEDEAKFNELLKEIRDMKEKMFIELNNLNRWKKSLNDAIDQWWSGPDSNNFGKEEKKGYKWYWKNVKSKLANTLGKFNVTNLYQKYVKVDKKKVTDAMESVGSYLRKAHENARKVIQENLKPDVMEFLGELKNKWNNILKTNHKTSTQTQQKDDNEVTIEPQDDENNNEKVDEYSLGPTEDLKSWLFDRAEYRSKEREEEFKKEVNWFLQKHSLREGERWTKRQQEEYEKDVNWFLQKHGLNAHGQEYERYVKPGKGKYAKK